MKGDVIGFDPDTNTGAISGRDGKRYDFASVDWRSRERPPRHGDVVDFAPQGQRAVEIYVVEPAYVAPTLAQFLFSFRGRIPRRLFWKWAGPIGVLIAMFWAVILFAYQAGNKPAVLGLAAIYVGFLFVITWCNAAVMVKRLHDRNRTGAYGLAWYLPQALLLATAIWAADMHGPLTRAVSLLLGALSVWFFLDLGCLRGTAGSNPYGPDPDGRR